MVCGEEPYEMVSASCTHKGLVTNYREEGGGLQNRRRGHVKFYPYGKGGGKSLAMLKGGHKKFRGSFYVVA